jgi:NAD(P)-dependent dehydrogenase (short-subunit alcohol dehydrogenase family)
MSKFAGRTYVVTGGASGIGEATVRAIIAEGGQVVIADLQNKPGEALSEELGPNAQFIQTDVTVEQDIIDAIALAQSAFGPLSGMVNNAGIIGAVGSILEIDAQAYDHTMSILSRAVFLGIKHAARAMKPNGSGAIVSLASTAGITGGLGPHVYTMAKHGVVGLTKSAASELSAYGIRINAIAPGGTVTAMTAALAGGDRDAIEKNIAETSPLGIACQPEDIANAIVFALSDEARYMTGQTLVIDAGQTTSNLLCEFHQGESEVLLHAGMREKG